MMSPRGFCMWAAAASLVISSAGLRAQVIEGQVADGETYAVLEDVSLTLMHPDGHDLGGPVVSSASGRFSVPVPGPGSYYLRVERLGYTGIVEGVFEFESAEGRLSVEVYLRRAPVELEGVDVAVEQVQVRRRLRASGFYERLTAGFGDFVTPEQIEERGLVSDVSEYLRSIPGISTYESLIVFRHQGASGGLVKVEEDGSFEPLFVCEPNIWVDGTLMTPASKSGSSLPRHIQIAVGPGARALFDEDIAMGIDDVLRANDVVAIEVYRTAASTPLEWGGLGTGCGTIVIWTKQGR